MSVKASSHSRIKTIKVICDRSKKSLRGFEAKNLPLDFIT